MSLFKGSNRIAGNAKGYTISDDAISDYSVSFVDDSDNSYTDINSCINAMTTGSQLSKLISVIKSGLSKMNNIINQINTTLDQCIKTKSNATLSSLKFKIVGNNTISPTENDTVANWSAQGCSVHNYGEKDCLYFQPSQYGLLLNLTSQEPGVVSGGEVHQIWLTQSTGDVCHRGGNKTGWNGQATVTTNAWRTFLDSSNYSSYTVPKTIIGKQVNGSQSTNTVTNSWTSNASISLSAGTWIVEAQVTFTGVANKALTIKLINNTTEWGRQTTTSPDGNQYTARITAVVKYTATTTLYMQTWSAGITSYNSYILRATQLNS